MPAMPAMLATGFSNSESIDVWIVAKLAGLSTVPFWSPLITPSMNVLYLVSKSAGPAHDDTTKKMAIVRLAASVTLVCAT